MRIGRRRSSDFVAVPGPWLGIFPMPAPNLGRSAGGRRMPVLGRSGRLAPLTQRMSHHEIEDLIGRSVALLDKQALDSRLLRDLIFNLYRFQAAFDCGYTHGR